MTTHEDNARDVRAFWNQRSQFGKEAGSRDIIAKEIEIKAIAKHVCEGQRIMDVGCGNGITAFELARAYEVDILGIDFAEEMVMAARDLEKGLQLKGTVRFETGDINDIHKFGSNMDLVYTERMLINLPDWETQNRAIKIITDQLADGGKYVMCENSQDGLDEINSLRVRVGLPEITPPWHNRYLRDEEIHQCRIAGVVLEEVDFYSSTYYLLSRVVNAAIAAQEGKEPDYNSPINQLALELPSIGKLGQGRIWVWRKKGQSG